MQNFGNRLLQSFRIPLATLTFVAFLIVLIEAFVNSAFTGLRIFTVIVLGINVIYLVVYKISPPQEPITSNPTTPTPNGDSQEA